MKIVTAAQMTAIEQASERAGVSTDTLMENAGFAVAQGARVLVGSAGVRILISVGPGNYGSSSPVAALSRSLLCPEFTCFLSDGRLVSYS